MKKFFKKEKISSFIKSYSIYLKSSRGYSNGFALIFTIMIVSVVAIVSAGIINSSYKQLVLSSLAKDSQVAFYQADTASDCAIYADLVKWPNSSPISGSNFDCGGQVLTSTLVGSDGSYDLLPSETKRLSSDSCFRIGITKNTTTSIPDTSWQADLVSWWNFDGNANDSIGGNDGTPNAGATLTNTDCFSGSCYDFNSSSSGYISIPNDSTLQMAGKSFTFFALINPETYFTTASWAGIIGGTTGSASLGIDSVSSSIKMTKVNNVDFTRSDLVPKLNEWNYVAVTFDNTSSTNNVTYYLNGTDSAHKKIVSNPLSSFNGGFAAGSPSNVIGARTSGTHYFNGKIDEVMIFDRLLPPEDIEKLYNSFSFTSTSVTNTKISAKGYNMCNTSNLRTVEREIKVDY